MNVVQLAQNSGHFHRSISLSSIQGVAEDELARGVATRGGRSRKGTSDKKRVCEVRKNYFPRSTHFKLLFQMTENLIKDCNF
jgi:hypothetical protein